MTLTLTRKENGSSLPAFVNEFFNDKFLVPSVLDIDGDLAGFTNALVVPEANIIENEKDFRIELAVPGLERNDFKVEVQNGVLSISAEKENESKEKGKNFRRREFSYNSFCRSFTLPENLLTDKIDAKYENGILHVVLPKKEVSVSKPVQQVKVN